MTDLAFIVGAYAVVLAGIVVYRIDLRRRRRAAIAMLAILAANGVTPAGDAARRPTTGGPETDAGVESTRQ